MTSPTSSKPEASPTSSKPKPSCRVLDSTDCGIDNYPGSVEAARSSVENLIQRQLKDGYQFAGNVSRFVGGELRTFYVFYLAN